MRRGKGNGADKSWIKEEGGGGGGGEGGEGGSKRGKGNKLEEEKTRK